MRRGIVLTSILLLASCGGDEKAPPTLDVVASEITFKSVERLGPHHLLATIEQEDDWTNGGREAHDETMELAWNNWDSFHLRRVVRGSTMGETIMSEGSAFSRNRNTRWKAEMDSEPARLRVQRNWNVWDTAMEVFDGRILLTETESSIVDGRAVQGFKVSLAPLPPGTRIRSGNLTPVSIEGEVWLDEATAVRLSADVTAKAEQDGLTRTVVLHLRRSAVGEEHTIVRPQAPVQPSTEVLRERMKGRPPSKSPDKPKATNP